MKMKIKLSCHKTLKLSLVLLSSSPQRDRGLKTHKRAASLKIHCKMNRVLNKKILMILLKIKSQMN